MNRRDFNRAIAAGAVLSALPAWPASIRKTPARKLIKPPILRPGSLVGLIAPGGVLDDAIIQKCVQNLESLGFRVKLSPNLRAAWGGYAGTIKQRLDDLHGMFTDAEVKAIWTARGGSGCSGLLPGIDYELLRRHAKILIGYSDITALHLALYRCAGLVTFHGPVAWSTPNDYAVTQMQAVLMSPRRETEIHMSTENARRAATQPEYGLRTFKHGGAEGPLVGGNLSIVSALAGTPYGADIRNHLLFLEEVREAPYRVDRMLTQLQQSAGAAGETHGLARAAGVMMGVFTRGNASPEDKSLSLSEVLDHHFAASPVPAVYGYSFGHISHQFTLPVGVRARLDTSAQTLTLLEAAVHE
ncbi:MAG: LD-carboxypeptidase [Betaproteobacteria bacterium]|nr:LD-carboxypeptidase [Betaproteobacteria bacterium]